jgi:hypothetical protein
VGTSIPMPISWLLILLSNGIQGFLRGMNASRTGTENTYKMSLEHLIAPKKKCSKKQNKKTNMHNNGGMLENTVAN